MPAIYLLAQPSLKGCRDMSLPLIWVLGLLPMGPLGRSKARLELDGKGIGAS